MTNDEPNPYQAPNDISVAAEMPLTAEDGERFKAHDPLAWPAVLCILCSLVGMMYTGLLLLIILASFIFGRMRPSPGEAGFAFVAFMSMGLIQFAGYAMLNRRYRLVVIFTSILGLFTCIFAPVFAVILFRLSKPDVWNSFR